MKHSEYVNLSRALESLTKGSDTLRALFSKVEAPADPATLEPGEPTTRWVPTDQARQHPLFPFRFKLLDMATRTVEETARTMDGCWDRWTDTNQARADQGLEPTADTRGLVQAMAGFMSATDTPTRGIAGLYDPTRSRCRAWMDQATTWFPDLNGNQEPGKESRPTSTPAKVDRDRMADLFIPKFKDPDPITRLVPFDNFCRALDSGDFTAKDIGRIAYQVQNSRFVLPKYKPGKTTFARFARLFYEFCGVPVPKDLAPRAYKDRTDKTDFDCWLN